MSRVIIFPHTKIFAGGMSFGPGQRLWEIAKALQRRGHNVTIAEKDRNKTEIKDKIRFVPWNDELLKNISKNYDVALAPIWCSDREFLDNLRGIPLAVDVSAPILVEHADHFSTTYSPNAYWVEHYIDDILIPSSLILSRGDFFVCANERQKNYYQGMMGLLGRLGPLTYRKKLIDVVPFGVSKEKPKRTKNVFRGIAKKNSRVILWPSAFLPWFDPLTAIEAMSVVVKKVPEAKLVFVGSFSPRAPKSLTVKSVKKAEERAKKLGLLNKSVFFVDWLPYEDRGNMYLESEFAVVTSKDCLETELAHRTRIIDCLWGRLPVICTGGDSVSEMVDRNGLGIVVEPGNPRILAEKMVSLLKDRKKLDIMSKKIDRFVQRELNWDNVIGSLHQFCSNPKIDEHKDRTTPFTVLQEKEHFIKTLIRNHRDYVKDLKGRLADKEVRIEEQYATIKHQGAEIKRRDRVIGGQKKEMLAELAKRDKIIEKLNEDMKAEIAKRDRTIEKLDEEIHKRGRTIEKISEDTKNEIQKRDRTIEKLDEEIHKRGRTIEKLSEEMRREAEKRDRVIDDLNIKLKAEIEERDKIIREKDKQLREIFESRGWKILTRVHKMKTNMGLTKSA